MVWKDFPGLGLFFFKNRFPWVSLHIGWGSTGFDRLWLGCTGFYWVFFFTGFRWVCWAVSPYISPFVLQSLYSWRAPSTPPPPPPPSSPRSQVIFFYLVLPSFCPLHFFSHWSRFSVWRYCPSRSADVDRILFYVGYFHIKYLNQFGLFVCFFYRVFAVLFWLGNLKMARTWNQSRLEINGLINRSLIFFFCFAVIRLEETNHMIQLVFQSPMNRHFVINQRYSQMSVEIK